MFYVVGMDATQTSMTSVVFNNPNNDGDDFNIMKEISFDTLTIDGIPINISNVYKGKWSGYIYRPLLNQPPPIFNYANYARQQQKHQQLATVVNYGEISMKLKCTETILKEYLFVVGDVHLRQGIYIHNRYYPLILDGVYNLFTHTLYFYLKPPNMSNIRLQGTRALFNDTGARLIYEISVQQKAEEEKRIDTQSESYIFDPNNICIFKGVLHVKRKADVSEQESQFHSYHRLSEVDKIRTSINLQMEGELIGLNCNSTIRISESTFSLEMFYEKAVHYSVMASLITFIQILALIYQMNFTSTQSSASRVSVFMIAMQAMLDSYITLMHMTIGIFIEGVFDVFTVPTFLSFVLFSIFEMRYLLTIWKATRPIEFGNGWSSMRQELQKLYFRFYGIAFLGLFTIYYHPIFFKYIFFLLYSFWAAQVMNNVMRNSLTSVHPLYVVVTSVTRMAIPCYFFLCPHNFISVETNPTFCMWLGAWLTGQAIVLVMQHLYGPRWFIPKLFEPKKYNYYRSIPQEILNEGEYNCVICMHPIAIEGRDTAIEMEDENSDSKTRSNSLERVAIHIEEGERAVVTRCSHIFHKACLQRWMAYSTFCPTCRAPLDDGL
jgi:hypothetical protein